MRSRKIVRTDGLAAPCGRATAGAALPDGRDAAAPPATLINQGLTTKNPMVASDSLNARRDSLNSQDQQTYRAAAPITTAHSTWMKFSGLRVTCSHNLRSGWVRTISPAVRL